MYEKIRENMGLKNNYLAPYACLDKEAYRFKSVIDDDFRTPFYRDSDRIVYSLSYTRYMDKTQVFSFNENDNISKRMTHVQMVSKIARTIGRALRLNEDLIEAAALGHDLGHVPFGHAGERILNEISQEYGEGYFNHNIQSVRLLMYVENYGKGYNLTLPVLDAIMCHNGEFVLGEYHKCEKTKEQFLEEYKSSYEDKRVLKILKPMTLEGCVVRISDMIAYLGKDIEDAVRLNIVSFKDIPDKIKRVLGTSNREIVNKIILDIIKNSTNKDYIKLSDEVFNAIVELKKFNYEKIYSKAYTDEELKRIEEMFKCLFNNYLKELKINNKNSIIYKNYLDKMSDEYKNNNSHERIVIDYIAGMTDDYLLRQYSDITNLYIHN